ENSESEKHIVDEIKDYLNACYLFVMEAAWCIFKYRITLQSPFRYFLHPLDPEFNNLTYCRYNKLYCFSYVENLIDLYLLPSDTYLEERHEKCYQRIVKPYECNHVHVAQIDIIQLVNGVLYSTFQKAACVLGLLNDITENEQCFIKAISYNCILAQLRLLFCHLFLEGMLAQTIWQNYRDSLSADYINKKEEHDSKITQFGLPQPLSNITEIMRTRLQYNNYNILIKRRDEMTNLLNSEQKKIYQKIIDQSKKIILPCATTGLAALNYDGGCTTHSLFRILVEYSDDGCKYHIKLDDERAELIRNLEAVDVLLRELCNPNLPMSEKIFIRIEDFHQVAPFMDNIGNGIGEENGLMLDQIILDLRVLVFSHGQLYTALTRVHQQNDILILTEQEHSSNSFTTKNIVYSELLE
ncbi:18057_t:CDS:2, partial [Cetraspora pellucida]